MASVKTIRALERGLDVLESFQIHPTCTLQDIHRTTQIPKPTLLRILETLQRAGVVTRRLGDGRYRISSNLTRIVPRRVPTTASRRRPPLCWTGCARESAGRPI